MDLDLVKALNKRYNQRRELDFSEPWSIFRVMADFVNGFDELQNIGPSVTVFGSARVDDLVTKGTKEPYRMFTSRAEYRLLLREDNATIRLSKYGHEIGLISDDEYKEILSKKEAIEKGVEILENNSVTPTKEFLSLLESINEEKITDKTLLKHMVARKSFDTKKLKTIWSEFESFDEEILEQVLIEAKYSKYIQKQSMQIDKMKEMINLKIPSDFCFDDIPGLSKEVIEKLKKFNPPTLFNASEISGITPAAIDILHLYINLRTRK